MVEQVRMARARNGRGGFTLIELMVVIVIVAVLFAVALPMFENAGRKDTGQAAQQLVNTMRLARQHAISRRQWTLVVFPTKDAQYSDYTKDINNLDKCLRSYAVLAVTNNMDGTLKWGPSHKNRDPNPDEMEFEFLTDWRMLPEGMYFDDDDSLQKNCLFGAEDFYHGAFDFPWDPAKPETHDGTMAAILFKPNGRAFLLKDNPSMNNKPIGKYWQDNEGVGSADAKGVRIYVTSAVAYPEAGNGKLGTAVKVDGGMVSMIKIHNKTGQIRLFDATSK